MDSIRPVPDELRVVIQAIAEERDLRLDWLNDNAQWFTPATFRRDACRALFEQTRLRVLGAPLSDVLIMKMYRGNEGDQQDMVKMWPIVRFDTAKDVVDAQYAAYPHVEEDPYLSDFVVRVARRAGFEIS